ncbi:MAG: hypothetical protein ACUVSL_08585 [Chloroflexus sp.]|uniref:hypothetical protein n=1 Tax=Chloroflexus sp. TaxID=1904827 RepID=UPI00404AB3B2
MIGAHGYALLQAIVGAITPLSNGVRKQGFRIRLIQLQALFASVTKLVMGTTYVLVTIIWFVEELMR